MIVDNDPKALAAQRAKQELARRILAKRHLIEFTRLTYPNYIPGAVHYDVCRRLERFSQQVVARESPRLMLTMPPRHGKLIADDVMVPTSKGFKPHGTIQIGDKLVGSDGKWTTVVERSPKDTADYVVSFLSGLEIICHGNHEWTVFERKRNHLTGVYTHVERTFETHQLAHKVAHLRTHATWIPPSERSNRITSKAFKMHVTNTVFWNILVPRADPKHMPYPYQRAWVNAKRPFPQHNCDAVVRVDRLPEGHEKIGRCLQVDAEDGLYALTESFLLTHNSELASIRFPAWHLGLHPDHEFIVSGYSLELPMKFSRRTRDLLRDPVYQAVFPATQLSQDSQSAEAWNTIHAGGYRAAGVGGGLTGHGAHILVIDDPFKNLEEADSATIRDKVWDWYQSAAYTRLAPGGGVLIIMTRWSDDDLVGRLLEASRVDEEADQWEVVDYPAMSTEYEYVNNITLEIRRETQPLPDELLLTHSLFREPDRSLHPDRFPEKMLTRIRSNLQPRIWSALYQHKPIPDEGLYFQKDWFRTQEGFPEYDRCRIITAWDFAIGEKQHNDYTVGVTLLHDYNDNLYLLDVCRFKGDTFVILTQMIRVMKMFSLKTALIKPLDYVVGVEDGQIWKTMRPLMEAELARERLPVPLHVLPTLTDKMARARALQSQLQRGKFVLPSAQVYDFVVPFVSELLRFPGGVHDDQVDAAAHAARLALDLQAPPQRERPKTQISWKDRLHELTRGSSGTTHMSS